jgi:hypothetical protein
MGNEREKFETNPSIATANTLFDEFARKIIKSEFIQKMEREFSLFGKLITSR